MTPMHDCTTETFTMKRSRALLIILALLATSVSHLSEQPISADSSVSFSPYELQTFEKHSLSRLPLYAEQFRKYSDLYQVPWTLIAAVAYQESKWDHKAVSHTGVRGLMQITELTAEHIGLENRNDPIESIRGGAYYLRYLFNKTSPNSTTMQRWAHALAAYNIGWGHFRDAYRLTLQLNKNPYNWNDLRDVLPKLEEAETYIELNHGFARGKETVEFVESVFSYYQLLNKNFSEGDELFKLLFPQKLNDLAFNFNLSEINENISKF